MNAFRLRQIGLALCLMASLLTASPAACACAHHEETKAVETDCHSHHESAKVSETAETGNSVDVACVCVVDPRSPLVVSTTVGKELKAPDAIAPSSYLAPDLEFVAATTFHVVQPTLDKDLSYSSTLKSLLPSRAPPRL